jgi:ABC-type branched-subunit amino acid transport system substrate-binding protein
VYRILYGFFNDAFTIVDVEKSIEESTISLFKQDIRDMDGFKEEKHNLISGERFEDGRVVVRKKIESIPQDQELETIGPDKGDKIVVGCITDLTKSTAQYGIGVTQGLSLRFNKENRAGGINGKNIEMVVLDHGYDPKLAVDHLEDVLSKYKTDVIIGEEGSPTLSAMLPYVESEKVLMLFPYTGSSAFRKPEQGYMGHFRTSYKNEAKALAKYAVEKRKARRFVVFYQNDAYGLDGLEGVREVLKKYKEEGKVEDWIETYYLRNTTDVRASVEKIKTFQPEVIILCSVNAATSALIRDVGIENLTNVILMGISPLGGEYVNFIKSKGLEYIVSNVVPNPHSDELEIVREYRQEMQRNGSKEAISIMSLEGYIGASIFIEILKRINGTITKEKIKEQMEAMQNYKYKGLNLTFDSQIRGFSKDIWIQSDDGWLLWNE